MKRLMIRPELAALANLPDDALIGVASVAALYSCSQRHVWRSADGEQIPPPMHLGRIVRWRLGTIRQHIRDGCPTTRRQGGEER
jgi:predicted DNA-binding transcriptional regulator AlpA